MGTSAIQSFNVPLACSSCEDRRTVSLHPALFDNLGREGHIQLFCAVCGTGTMWRGVETDRRSGFDRRMSPQARLELPILVRCDHPAQQFSEVSTTQTASSRGASFRTHHQLREGMNISIVLPFKEDDPDPIESRARVAWLRPGEDVWEIGIELLR